jgi:hypothetical protein
VAEVVLQQRLVVKVVVLLVEALEDYCLALESQLTQTQFM